MPLRVKNKGTYGESDDKGDNDHGQEDNGGNHADCASIWKFRVDHETRLATENMCQCKNNVCQTLNVPGANMVLICLPGPIKKVVL